MSQIITDSTGMPLSGAADTLARNLIARLNATYPAFHGLWQVHVNEAGGVIEVMNLALSGRWGFLMHIANIDAEGRNVVRAGGELLERYAISRANRVGVIMDQLQAAKRDYRGDLVPAL